MSDPGWANRKFADIAGIRTAYLDSGAGPALIMIHGVGLNASVWQPQIQAFDAEYRVIACDTLGHGGSTLPRDGASLEDYLDQLRSLLDFLAVDRAILMGHSMGALIAARFAIDHGERVDALVAVNPVYRRPEAQLANSRARIRALEQRGSGADLGGTLSRWFDQAELDSPPVRRIEAWMREVDPLGYARAYKVFSEADPWLAGRLGTLEVPALFVTGELDPNSSPAMAHAMALEAPFGRAAVLAGQRHMMAYISPERFNPVVHEFLDQSAAPASRAASRAGCESRT